MASLPIVENSADISKPARGRWTVPVHICRVALFIGILFLIRHKHAAYRAAQSDFGVLAAVEFEQFAREATDLMPDAVGLRMLIDGQSEREFVDSQGSSVGRLIQSSPHSDRIVGYIGPTNLAIAINSANQIAAVEILHSADTSEHIDEIRISAEFLQSYQGLAWDEADNWPEVDAVSGATLSSYAISQSIAARAGGEVKPLKFPDPVTTEELTALGLNARVDDTHESAIVFPVSTGDGKTVVGYIARTSPTADSLPGYQGPTDAMLILDKDRKLIGIEVRSSFDNQPYVGYVKEDRYLAKLLSGKTLKEISIYPDSRDPECNYEGVSGATMTSLNVLDGVVATATAAAAFEKTLETERLRSTSGPLPGLGWKDIGTIAVCVLGLLIGLTRLRSIKWFRICFLVAALVYLGFISGDILSQALVVGWSQNGMPLSVAPGLIFLVVAAFAVPIFTKHNVYCSHVCPFGAVQQLTIKRAKPQLKLGKFVSRMSKLIPAVLLVLVFLTGVKALDLNLAALEAFDAFSFRVAGWATICVAIVGLIASLFVPLAYCRFGCPTGAVLDYLRFNSKSDKVGLRDLLAVGCLIVGIVI